MVKRPSSAALDATFGALSDPTRRAIVDRLSRGRASVSELARPFDMSLVAVSKHIRVLEDAGLLSVRKEGRVRWCALQAGPLRDTTSWFDHYRKFWEGQLDALAEYVEQPSKTRTDGRRRR